MNKTTCIPNIRPSIRQTVDLTEKWVYRIKCWWFNWNGNGNWKIHHTTVKAVVQLAGPWSVCLSV